MGKVITFSRQFQKGHPKAGQPTYFVEQVLNALGIYMPTNSADFQSYLCGLNTKSIAEGKLSYEDIIRFCSSLSLIEIRSKIHTIRSGNRWKAGEKASLRVWSGVPYDSPQIIFAPDVELKQVIPISISKTAGNEILTVVGRSYASVGSSEIEDGSIFPKLAKNDGLALQDFLDWFKYPQPFEGQILAWRAVDYV